MFPTRPLTRVAPRLLAAALLVTAACGSDDSSSGGDSSDNLPDAEGANKTANGGGTLVWENCGPQTECAELEVPLDHENPAGEKLTLGITRVPADGERIGSLFVNPGGPGAAVADLPAGMASQFPSEITESFDIVALDPRGVGETSLVDCGYDWSELYGVDHAVDSPDEEDELLTTSQDYVDSCSAAVGDDFLQQMGTRNVARDMDMAREAMGDDQISYLGYSYGTSIGQVYADMFPERVRAMVLDGIVELGTTGMESAEAQALGFEAVLQSFADDCDSSPDRCPLAPDTIGEIETLAAAIEDDPVSASPRDLGPSELDLAMARALYQPDTWPALAQGLVDARDGDGSGLVQLADQYLSIANFDVYFGVNCLDAAWPDNPDDHMEEAASIGQTAPHFGETLANDYIRCSLWPVEPDPLEPTTAPGTPPIVVVSTTNDPATPYDAGVNLAETLEEGVLVTYEGDQHGVVGYGNGCIDDAVFTYLLDLDPPDDGTRC